MPDTQIMFYHLALQSQRKSGPKLKEKHNEQNTAFQSNILVAATTCARNFQRVDDEKEAGAGAGDSDGTGSEKMEDNDLGGDVNDNNDDDGDEENGGEDGGWVEKGARSGESCSCAEALTCNVIAPPCAMQGFAM